MKLLVGSAGAFALMIGMLTGCAVQWKASWPQVSSGHVESRASPWLVERARVLTSEADDKAALRDAIAAYEKVAAVAPGNLEALTRLSSQYILLGTAYTGGRSEKQTYFHQAMKYAEWAMYTNPVFRERVNAGASPWQAAEALGEREMEAALLWATAVQYEFKEVMYLPGKIINIGRLKHTQPLLQHIESIDPDFGGGAIQVALSINYFVLPSSMGGDPVLGKQYMERAAEKHRDWLVSRWARGKYYEDLSGNTEGVREDLEWVLSRDISRFEDPYPWRVHFQDDARRLLGRSSP